MCSERRRSLSSLSAARHAHRYNERVYRPLTCVITGGIISRKCNEIRRADKYVFRSLKHQRRSFVYVNNNFAPRRLDARRAGVWGGRRRRRRRLGRLTGAVNSREASSKARVYHAYFSFHRRAWHEAERARKHHQHRRAKNNYQAALASLASEAKEKLGHQSVYNLI